jgi:hypothetical protein
VDQSKFMDVTTWKMLCRKKIFCQLAMSRIYFHILTLTWSMSLNMAIISKSTFNPICRHYVYPVTVYYRNLQKELILHNVRDMPLALCGDALNDSPGHCAQYSIYFYGCQLGYLLHYELVDKREVDLKSPNMEKEGCLRGLTCLKDKVKIMDFTTDQHPQIQALVKYSLSRHTRR